jgi:hypothetical protein
MNFVTVVCPVLYLCVRRGENGKARVSGAETLMRNRVNGIVGVGRDLLKPKVFQCADDKRLMATILIAELNGVIDAALVICNCFGSSVGLRWLPQCALLS